MATLKEKEEQERKIAVLTVQKNGTILKNIFLNSPPAFQSESEKESGENSEKSGESIENVRKDEEKLIIGRHPDCNIVLEHPSISRFHLQIQLHTSLQKVSVTDLASVHGTWVSGKKIDPQIPVELQEGDTLGFGASTRIYRLQWVPLRSAFDIESPLVSTLLKEHEVYQDENSVSSSKKQEDLWPVQIPTAPPLPQSANSEDFSTIEAQAEREKQSPPRRSKQWDSSNLWSRRGKASGFLCVQTTRWSEENKAVNVAAETEIRNYKEMEMPEQADGFLSHDENLMPKMPLGLKFEKKPNDRQSTVEVSRVISTVEQGKKDMIECSLQGSSSKVLATNFGTEEDKFPSGKENLTPKKPLGLQLKKSATVNSKIIEQGKREIIGLQGSSSKGLAINLDTEDKFPSDKENLTPNLTLGFKAEKHSACVNSKIEQDEREMIQIGLQGSSSKVLATNFDAQEDKYPSDKVNSTPKIPGFKAEKNSASVNSKMIEHDKREMIQIGLQGSSSKVLATNFDAQEDKYPSDKVNSTPKIPGFKAEKNSASVNSKMIEHDKREMIQIGLQGSSSKVLATNFDAQEDKYPSDKENSTPKIPRFTAEKNSASVNSKMIEHDKREMIQIGLQGSSSKVLSTNFDAQDDKYPSDKENSTTKIPGFKAEKNSASVNSKMIEHDKREMIQIGLHGSSSKALATNFDAEEDKYASDKENSTVKIPLGFKAKKNSASVNSKMIEQNKREMIQIGLHGSSSKVLATILDAEDKYPSDQENSTPKLSLSFHAEKNSASVNSKMTEHDKREMIQIGLQGSSSRVLATNFDAKEDKYPSDEENSTPKIPLGFKAEKISASVNSKMIEQDKREMIQIGFQGSSSKVLATNFDAEDKYPSDKENSTPKIPLGLKSKTKSASRNSKIDTQMFSSMVKQPFQRSCSKVLFPNSESVEDTFSSDQKNLTPKIPLDPKSEKKSACRKQETVQPEVQASLSIVRLTDLDMEESVLLSEKENLTPQISRDRISKKKPIAENPTKFEPKMMIPRKVAERVPFQILLTNSPSNSRSVLNATSRNSNTINHTDATNRKRAPSADQSVDQTLQKFGEEKKRWNMVVDTSCFLNEESRRSLKLLEGLKGTHLIIPRIVIRELDCLKRRGSRCRKATEASLILQWIEECMVKTKWWVHVQSSTEITPIAETPPVSPRLRLSEGSNECGVGTANSIPFSTCGSFMEIVSPTAEDHILECTLLFKKIKTDGQLVLLTNDIALKIKAMAEGLVCETPKDFCDSLVNPYSERFLWAESTPRGPTWSSLDEVGLRTKCGAFEEVGARRKAAEGAKGLKLILLHNSHYGQINSVK